MMRTTSPLQTFQLLKPTPWCRSTDVEDTMQSNAEAGESWQGNFVLVADVAFLAVEMATEPPSRCDACCSCLRVSHHVACLLFVDVQATILASWFKRGQTQCTASASSRGGCVLQVLCVCVSLWGSDGLTARCDSIIHSETAARVIQYQQTVRLTQRERNASDSPSAPG